MSVPDERLGLLDHYLGPWLKAVARRVDASLPPETLKAAGDDVRRHFLRRHGRVIIVDGRPACSICGSRGIFLTQRRVALRDVDVKRSAEAAATGAATVKLYFAADTREVHDERAQIVECGCGAELDEGDLRIVAGQDDEQDDGPDRATVARGDAREPVEAGF